MLPSDREARGSYGGPRTGDPVFAQFVSDTCNVFRYINLGDPESPVPWLGSASGAPDRDA